MIPRLPSLGSIRCKSIGINHPVFRLQVCKTFGFQQRHIHITHVLYGRPSKKKQDMNVVDLSKDDGMEESAHEGITVHGIKIPKKLQHWFTDPYGKKSRRDDIQERKVKRLKAIHDRSKMPSIFKKTKEIDTGYYSWNGKKMLSIRQVRVAKYIQEQLQMVIQEAKGGLDDHMSRIIVDEVEVTKDLRSATIFWSTMDIYSKERYRLELEKGKLITSLRAKLASRISHMKFIPELQFVSSDVLITQEQELEETETLIEDAKEEMDDLDSAMEEWKSLDDRLLIPHESDLDVVKQEMELLQERSKILQEKGWKGMTKEDWDYYLEPTRIASKKLLLSNSRIAKLKQTRLEYEGNEEVDIYVDDDEEAKIKNQQREAALKSMTPEDIQEQTKKVWSVMDITRFKGIERNSPDEMTLGSFINEMPGEQPPAPPEDPNAEVEDLKKKHRITRERIRRKRITGRTTRGKRS